MPVGSFHTDDELNALVANGTLSPETAEAARNQRDTFMSQTGGFGGGANFNMVTSPSDPPPVLSPPPSSPPPSSDQLPPITANDAPPTGSFGSPPPMAAPIPNNVTPPPNTAQKKEQSGITASADQEGQPHPLAVENPNAPGDTRTTTTTDTQFTQHGTTKGALEELQASQADAIKAEATFGQAKANALGIAADRQEQANRLNADMIAKNDARRLTDAKLLDNKQKEVNDAINEYQNYKLDSGRWFANQSLAGKVFAALGLMAGGMGQALSGAENPAIKIINEAVDRDIRLQEHELNQKRGNVELQNTVYHNMREKFADENMAREATRAAVMQKMDRELEAIKTRTAGDVEKSTIEKAQADIRAKQADSMAHLMANTVTSMTKTSTAEVTKPSEKLTELKAQQEDTIRTLDNLITEGERLKKEGKLGPVAGKWNEAKGMFGRDDPEISAYKAALDNAAITHGRALFQRVPAGQIDKVTKNFGDVTQNPNTLLSLLRQNRENMLQKYETTHRDAAAGGYNIGPPNYSSTPKSNVGFKPSK